jgi:hypothetical protein
MCVHCYAHAVSSSSLSRGFVRGDTYQQVALSHTFTVTVTAAG